MKGHIRQRNCSWPVIFDIGRDPVTGRRRQRAKTFRTKRQAMVALNSLLATVVKAMRGLLELCPSRGIVPCGLLCGRHGQGV